MFNRASSSLLLVAAYVLLALALVVSTFNCVLVFMEAHTVHQQVGKQ